MFFIHIKKKKIIYLIGYQDNPGARTWLNFNRALQCVSISLYARESAKPDCQSQSSYVFCYLIVLETTEILFNGHTDQRICSSTDRKKHADKLFNKHTVQQT